MQRRKVGGRAGEYETEIVGVDKGRAECGPEAVDGPGVERVGVPVKRRVLDRFDKSRPRRPGVADEYEQAVARPWQGQAETLGNDSIVGRDRGARDEIKAFVHTARFDERHEPASLVAAIGCAVLFGVWVIEHPRIFPRCGLRGKVLRLDGAALVVAALARESYRRLATASRTPTKIFVQTGGYTMAHAPIDLRPVPAAPRPGPVSLLLRLVLGLFALALPLFALWVVTSLVLHGGAPLWLALTVGVLAVVGLPIFWDMWAESRFLRRQNPPPRILTRADRIRLRILVVSAAASAFLIVAVAHPTTNALAKRGDWLLFGSQGAFANDMRGAIGSVASGLAGLTGTSLDVAVASTASPDLPDPANTPVPSPSAPAVAAPTDVEPTPADVMHTAPGPRPTPPVARRGEEPVWPLAAEPHPLMSALRDPSSIEKVAEIIRAGESDPYQRVKAIHDFVVHWVAYDAKAVDANYTPPTQEAPTVFKRRVATCDGYTNLMLAIGKLTGDDLVAVIGKSRADGVGLDGFLHSWVGATINGKRYLIDPTWDAGQVFGGEFRPRYSTSYLFTPPDIFAYDHLPDEAAWSLTDPPLTQDHFLSRPTISAHFFAWGMKVDGIAKAVTPVSNQRVDFKIKNPKKAWVLVVAMPIGEGRSFNCVVPSQADPIEVGCKLTKGKWMLDIYANDSASGRYPLVASLRVDSN